MNSMQPEPTCDRRALFGFGAGVALATVGCASATAGGGGRPMSEGAFSGKAGDRTRQAVRGFVDRGEVPGLVTWVSRGGDAKVDAIGSKALGVSDPMRKDSIFRISSMTKPITAVAALLLVEDRKLVLDEPIERLLPELANRKVLRRVDGPLDDTVPAKRSITVRDLLTFRMGFGQPAAPLDAYPIQRAQSELGLMTLGPPMPSSPHAPDEWMRRFATLPLMHQPGEKWMYNTGAHVLGVLIARAADRPLETFFRERIFEPLGMKDTSFSVPASKLDRLVTEYRADPKTGKLVLFDGVTNSQWSRPPAFPDGAAGLVSTVDDYAAFAQMLMNQGALGQKRILLPASVLAMITNYVTPAEKAGSELFLGDRGWGFGVAITTTDGPTMSEGTYGWDGGFGTSWANDPKRNRVGILMTQRLWDSPKQPEVCRAFWSSV
jgi:CubicO group peptidase (beta-lactamase class C family)